MLSIGEPDAATPPSIVDAAVDALRAGRTHYASSQGEPGLRGALAERYTSRSGRPVGEEQVLFAPGAHTALYVACQTLLDPGAHLLVPEPYYAAYDAVFASAGAEVVPVRLRPEDDFHLRMDDLEAAAAGGAAALVLNSPHNPTGAVLDPDRVAEIARFCRDEDLWLLADEVYEDLVYGGEEIASPLDLPDGIDRTVVVSSVSKSHAMTGWRCGWAVGPAPVIDRMREVSESVMFGAQPFLQDATEFALRNQFEECAQMRADYERRADLVVEKLASSEAVDVHRPQGGIFVMVDVRAAGGTGTEFARTLLSVHRVATMPGESFGPSAAGHIRVSLTAPDEDLAEGCARIQALAEGLAR